MLPCLLAGLLLLAALPAPLPCGPSAQSCRSLYAIQPTTGQPEGSRPLSSAAGECTDIWLSAGPCRALTPSQAGTLELYERRQGAEMDAAAGTATEAQQQSGGQLGLPGGSGQGSGGPGEAVATES